MTAPSMKSPTVTTSKVDWQSMFWKLAILICLGWYDEARRFIETAIRMPEYMVEHE